MPSGVLRGSVPRYPAVTMTDNPFEPRLLKLEEKVAYQDKLIAELNDVVAAINRENSELRERVSLLERTLRSELGPREMPNERPPHY
jgi:uncharacterized coiled-coil protein SlyX